MRKQGNGYDAPSEIERLSETTQRQFSDHDDHQDKIIMVNDVNLPRRRINNNY